MASCMPPALEIPGVGLPQGGRWQRMLLPRQRAGEWPSWKQSSTLQRRVTVGCKLADTAANSTDQQTLEQARNLTQEDISQGHQTVKDGSLEGRDQQGFNQQYEGVTPLPVGMAKTIINRPQGAPFDRLLIEKQKEKMFVNDPGTYNTNSMFIQEGFKIDQMHQFTKPIMLFDLNGTLTIHKNSKGNHKVSKVRPGIQALVKLRNAFHIGIYTTSTANTVAQIWELLDERIGLQGADTIFDRRLMLHRDYTRPIAGYILQQEGEDAHTHYKPLGIWFENLSKVILVDDEKFKLADQERSNGLFIPTWDEDQTSPLVLQTLAVRLAKLGEAVMAGKVEDVRPYLKRFSAELIQASQMRRA